MFQQFPRSQLLILFFLSTMSILSRSLHLSSQKKLILRSSFCSRKSQCHPVFFISGHHPPQLKSIFYFNVQQGNYTQATTALNHSHVSTVVRLSLAELFKIFSNFIDGSIILHKSIYNCSSLTVIIIIIVVV